MKSVLTVVLLTQFWIAALAQQPEALAQQQLDGYNARNIEAFLQPYADSVEVYAFPGKLLYKGKHIMRSQYADMFSQLPDLRCTVVKRIAIGQTVIDEESVIFDKNKPPVRAIAIYQIRDGRIASVHFISGEQ